MGASVDRRDGAGRSGRRIVFPLMLLLFGLMYLWRMSGLLRVDPITAHLSNFYLSGFALTVLSGPRAFLDVSQRPRVLVAAAVLGLINVAAEVLLPLLGVDDVVNRALGDVNTSDPVDALFGLAAIPVVLVLLPRRQAAIENGRNQRAG